MTDKQSFTPPEVAERWGVKPSKVLAMIRNGELRALDLATPGCSRPRYKVLAADLLGCEEGRCVCKREKAVRPARPRLPPVLKKRYVY